jgi:isochorismate synthase
MLLRKNRQSVVQVLSQNSKELHKTPHDKMTYGVFSKFQKQEDQVIVLGEVVKNFDWKLNDDQLDGDTQTISKKDQLQHEWLVQGALDTIKRTDLKKVVISRKQPFTRTTTDLEIIAKLLDFYPSANCYFFFHPSVGKWMGATPETLLSYKKGVLKTMSLAGTKTKGNSVGKAWGTKESEEQQLVTDFIREALNSSSVSEIKVGKVETVTAGKLLHLKTEITAQTYFQNLDNCIDQLHPTPAVCGLPRKMALAYILTHENYDRSYYTGYLGWSEPQNETADYFVNLRCMELHDEYIDLYAGGGITAMSDPKAEYQEVQNKLLTMAAVLS